MEASKEGEMPSETAPETLPTEIKEERKKFPMLLAVIIVIILVIAALGAAFGLGLFGKKKEATNLAPTAGARADVTTIAIGGTVHFSR
jgi:flagellar basal body-associated protein FliL